MRQPLTRHNFNSSYITIRPDSTDRHSDYTIIRLGPGKIFILILALVFPLIIIKFLQIIFTEYLLMFPANLINKKTFKTVLLRGLNSLSPASAPLRRDFLSLAKVRTHSLACLNIFKGAPAANYVLFWHSLQKHIPWNYRLNGQS